MKFNQLYVRITAADGLDYGYRIEFKRGLNVIRGANSSGKSTFVNSLIYALGMEEIIGAKGNSTLPYALKDRFDFRNQVKKVVNSTVFLEIENNIGNIITLKRAIKSDDVDTKLIQIIEGAYLSSSSEENFGSSYTFVHDPGSAQDQKKGFYAYLEKFLGFNLPRLSDNQGRETKLYLQSVFSALLIEQKRGWTDYIANIPYYGVSGMREKVANFLLDLDSFRNAKKLNELQSERNKIINEWSELATEAKLVVEGKLFSISGITKTPSTDFDPKLIEIKQISSDATKTLSEVKSELFEASIAIMNAEKAPLNGQEENLILSIEQVQNRIDELLTFQAICGRQIKVDESQLSQYLETLESIQKDLLDNKRTQKLVNYGANEADLDIAKGRCHTCLTIIDDILVSPDTIAMPMTIEENIIHLDSQRKMTESLLEGLRKNIERNKGQLLTINREVLEKKKELAALKRDIKSTSDVKETDIRKKILLENRQEEIRQLEEKIEIIINKFVDLSAHFKELNASITNLSKYQFTLSDLAKIKAFSTSFKQYAVNFGYRSADVEEIEVKSENLLPYLQGIELREQIDTPTERKQKEATSTTDLKSDSSASDFVRLIWSYLIALYKASHETGGNHPGIILFDEPAQHSMSTKSVNKMLSTLADEDGLQSIIAASFDENEETYAASIDGIDNFTLIHLPSKIITLI
ncbi:hypothetical protein V9N51_001870 [Vibrio cholerae]|nr:Kinesin-related protein K4 [Vibrio cholerae]